MLGMILSSNICYAAGDGEMEEGTREVYERLR